MSCIIIIQSLRNYDVNKLVFGPFPVSCYLSTHFQYSWQKVQIKGANDWSHTTDLRFRKRPLYQLRHKHCPRVMMLESGIWPWLKWNIWTTFDWIIASNNNNTSVRAVSVTQFTERSLPTPLVQCIPWAVYPSQMKWVSEANKGM